MPKDHQKKPTDLREPLTSSAHVLLATVSLLSVSLGVSGATAANGSEPATDVEENNSTQLAQANFSKVQTQYTTQSMQQLQSNQQKIQGLQSNQNKLERKAGKGQQEFLQSNQHKIQGLQSNQNKLERKPLVKGQHIPETSMQTIQGSPQRVPGKLEIPNRKQ
jgi:7-keto-8-aminopelargonate synthetase-like enzyme